MLTIRWVPAGVSLLNDKPENKPLAPAFGLSYAPVPVVTVEALRAYLKKRRHQPPIDPTKGLIAWQHTENRILDELLADLDQAQGTK